MFDDVVISPFETIYVQINQIDNKYFYRYNREEKEAILWDDTFFDIDFFNYRNNTVKKDVIYDDGVTRSTLLYKGEDYLYFLDKDKHKHEVVEFFDDTYVTRERLKEFQELMNKQKKKEKYIG